MGEPEAKVLFESLCHIGHGVTGQCLSVYTSKEGGEFLEKIASTFLLDYGHERS